MSAVMNIWSERVVIQSVGYWCWAPRFVARPAVINYKLISECWPSHNSYDNEQ